MSIFCRALAAMIFNDTTRIEFLPLSADDRFTALLSKKVDVLSRNSTWTMGRESDLGVIFAAITYYDGQGFMVRKALNIDSALQLSDKSICVQSGTTTELNLADYFRNNLLTYRTIVVPSADEALKAYVNGRCESLTSDVSQLYALRSELATPRDHIILPDVISKEPLSPVVRDDDFQWLKIVKWTQFAMLDADELGVDQANIGDATKSQKPSIRRLLGVEGNFGEKLGLTKDWAARIIRLVGNYGDSYERNVGTHSKLASPAASTVYGIGAAFNMHCRSGNGAIASCGHAPRRVDVDLGRTTLLARSSTSHGHPRPTSQWRQARLWR